MANKKIYIVEEAIHYFSKENGYWLLKKKSPLFYTYNFKVAKNFSDKKAEEFRGRPFLNYNDDPKKFEADMRKTDREQKKAKETGKDQYSYYVTGLVSLTKYRQFLKNEIAYDKQIAKREKK